MARSLGPCIMACLLFTACTSNNVTVDNSLQHYFDSAGVKGTFALFDNMHGQFQIYNLSRYSDSFYTPGATFDILQSLVAIQSGVVKDDHSKIVQAPDTSHSLMAALLPGSATLGECFRDTSGALELGFDELGAHELGRDTLKKWVDSLQYGNKDVGHGDIFWESGPLKINADQQLGLLKKLYFSKLPFFDRPQEIVTGMFTTERNSAYRLCYKLAQATEKGGGNIGWALGWVEENKHPYFFVVNVESANPQKDLRATGLDIAREILKQLGFFQGHK